LQSNADLPERQRFLPLDSDKFAQLQRSLTRTLAAHHRFSPRARFKRSLMSIIASVVDEFVATEHLDKTSCRKPHLRLCPA
jgi:hypothetical protein